MSIPFGINEFFIEVVGGINSDVIVIELSILSI